MKIERKKGLKRIRIEHNWRLFLIILILIVIFSFLIYFIVQNKPKTPVKNSNSSNIENEECQIDSECVPSSCCHAESCILKDNAPECGKILCSMVCSGPLDCGAGHCRCLNNKCAVVKD